MTSEAMVPGYQLGLVRQLFLDWQSFTVFHRLVTPDWITAMCWLGWQLQLMQNAVTQEIAGAEYCQHVTMLLEKNGTGCQFATRLSSRCRYQCTWVATRIPKILVHPLYPLTIAALCGSGPSANIISSWCIFPIMYHSGLQCGSTYPLELHLCMNIIRQVLSVTFMAPVEDHHFSTSLLKWRFFTLSYIRPRGAGGAVG